MMRALLLRIWTRPWPHRVRRVLEFLATRNSLQRLVVPHFKVGVVGVIRNDRGEYLLFRHTYRTSHPWGLPTGFMEHGEQPERALRREIHEEAGLRVALSGVWKVEHDTRRRIVSIVYQGVATGDGFVGSQEVSEARFFPFSGLPRLLDDQRRLVEAAQQEEAYAGSTRSCS